MSTKFQFGEHAKKIGSEQVWAIQRVIELDGQETVYEVQLGEKVGTRVWAKECELERA